MPIELHHVEKTADTQYSKQNLPTNQGAVFHQIQTNETLGKRVLNTDKTTLCRKDTWPIIGALPRSFQTL